MFPGLRMSLLPSRPAESRRHVANRQSDRASPQKPLCRAAPCASVLGSRHQAEMPRQRPPSCTGHRRHRRRRRQRSCRRGARRRAPRRRQAPRRCRPTAGLGSGTPSRSPGSAAASARRPARSGGEVSGTDHLLLPDNDSTNLNHNGTGSKASNPLASQRIVNML